MVSDPFNVISLFNLVHLINAANSVIGAFHHDNVTELVTLSVDAGPLGWISKSHILLVLASINLDKWCIVSAVEARMLARAELVELIDNIVKL